MGVAQRMSVPGIESHGRTPSLAPIGGTSAGVRHSMAMVPGGPATIRFGGTVRDRTTMPPSETHARPIASPIPNVWTTLAATTQADSPGSRMPIRRSRRVRRIATRNEVPHQTRVLRWYDIGPGTLPSLWQRQNDVNCAPVARRRTTVASQTPVAARQPRLLSIPVARVPPRQRPDTPTRSERLCAPRLGVRLITV